MFRDVGVGSEGEEVVVEPVSPSKMRSHEILHANGDVTEVVGMNSLPTEILHLIFLHLNASVGTLSDVSLVSRYVTLLAPCLRLNAIVRVLMHLFRRVCGGAWW